MSHEVVTVGGGNGSPVVNEALFRTNTIDSINAIAAVYDSGGATGRRRLDAHGQELAYSDAMRILLSLVPPNKTQTPSFLAMKELLNHRDESETVLGQEIFNRFFSEETGFSKIENLMRAFGINLKGHVIPSSTKPSHISFVTTSGRTFRGEHLFDDQRMSKDMVLDMYLDPSVNVYAPAATAIEKAKLIILSCGSLYGSVLSNFLPDGMKDSLSKSGAKMFLVTNLVSTRNETHDFTPLKFIETVERYTGKRPDGLIIPEMTRQEFESKHSDVSGLYDLEQSHFLGWESNELYRAQEEGVKIITHHATSIVTVNDKYKVVRHNPGELSTILQTILP